MKVDRVVEFKWLAERSRFFAVLFPAAGEDDGAEDGAPEKGRAPQGQPPLLGLPRPREAAARDRATTARSATRAACCSSCCASDDLEGGLLVSRVFGGVKLGVGGVSRAFREAGEGAISEYLNSQKK